MKKLFISDLHLGSPLFKKEKEVINLLISDIYNEIFILGDVFDCWEGNVWMIFNKYREMIKILNDQGNKIVLIKGNHDPSFEVLTEVLYNCKIIEGVYNSNFNGQEIAMSHGNEFDPDYWWTKAFFPIHWVLQRFGFNVKGWIREKIYISEAKRLGVSLDDIVVEAERKLVNEFKSYDIYVCGHSHMPKIVQTESLLFVNVGSLIYKPCFYEFEDGKFIKKEI